MMDHRLDLAEFVSPRLGLPVPARRRWQPLRMGLVELYHYDSEEFWFRDGHLLLRGNNGTGKSKVLSLTLPFLFDAVLRSSRLEPDGDSGKKMAWNLLMNAYDRRIGYCWIEFGRNSEGGEPRYLTLGCGLSAVAARTEVEAWFFILDDAPDGARLGQDLWLINRNRVVLTRERLREAIDGHGQVFETAAAYRRAVDERLFRLGPKRYDALMDTLIQLRQPQLSRKPDETALSSALTEALPPLPSDLLSDVAEALNQLDEDRRQLDEFKQLEQAVAAFDARYRTYAGTISRRQARDLRQAQTEYDSASRDRNDSLGDLDRARAEERHAETAYEQAKLDLAGARARLETLQADPTMQDANRLEGAASQAAARDKARHQAVADHAAAMRRWDKEQAATRSGAARLAQAEEVLISARARCADPAERAGVTADFAATALATLDPAALAGWDERAFEPAQSALDELVAGRREQVALVRRRRAALDTAEADLARKQAAWRDYQESAVTARLLRDRMDTACETKGQALVEAWTNHFDSLRQLRCDKGPALKALTEWVVTLDGDNPARVALHAAQQEAGRRLAAQQIDLDGRNTALSQEQIELEAERANLEAGRDSAPPLPLTRVADTRLGRSGAPLWQVIDFRDDVTAAARAGLEAALQASGLLDAWITPDGALIATDDGAPWLDSQMIGRPPLAAGSLADWMHPAVPAGLPVPAATVAHLLAGVACAGTDPASAEAWLAPDGRFRLGGLTGAWTKPHAEFIGFAAQAEARTRRLDEIGFRLEQLADQRARLAVEIETLAEASRQAERDWCAAPSDETLRQAWVEARAAATASRQAEDRVTEAEAVCRAAEPAVRVAQDALEWDAVDLRLPTRSEALQRVEDGLNAFNDARHRLVQAAQDGRRAWLDRQRQQERDAEAGQEVEARAEHLETCRIEAEEAQARYQVLRNVVGAKVESLRQHLAEARESVRHGEATLSETATVARRAGEARVVAATRAEIAGTWLDQKAEARAQAVSRLQRFAETSLLSAALPTIALPDFTLPWTIDPALTLARKAEQALNHLKDDDETWARVQRQTAADYQDLQRALGALGHQAPAETSDWGLVVSIIYQNRPQRPDQLALRLADEIAQRGELLTAREREVLENHLQAEIAAEIQRLLRAAERQVAAINAELHKRPTATGVRYRLQWQPLGENEGAPAGLEAARQRLLNTSADLWTIEDRRVVGTMLQSRISTERDRADTDPGIDENGSLLDLLTRALDYRHWHRFRVQRFQDGQWRKLSGPASSGERALGLTVPLFAAVASFYGQGGDDHAPRLMLLDEAFAGIDGSARAHCMALIREFDLDFVITSEQEWGCYADLPGVAICQLQRREGIDAVYVSRWSWDGRARRQEEDPNRRFPPPLP